MSWSRMAVASVAIALAAFAGACDDSPTTPTNVDRVTETFSGTINQLGSENHPFSVRTAGQVDILLTSLGPLSTLSMGVGIGSWDGNTSTCTLITVNQNARQGTIPVLSGTAQPGSLCVRIYDVGNIQPDTSVTYELQVVHP